MTQKSFDNEDNKRVDMNSEDARGQGRRKFGFEILYRVLTVLC